MEIEGMFLAAGVISIKHVLPVAMFEKCPIVRIRQARSTPFGKDNGKTGGGGSDVVLNDIQHG